MSALSLRKATRQQTKIRIGLSGPSGSGKTYSALLLASGMAPWEKIAVIDTENGSADLYSHLGGYSVITLTAPFSPERYIEAIEACEKSGMEVIIIDSVTHEWDGKGGCLESNELIAQTKFKGNTWAAWSVTTPRHQKFIAAIVGSSCHIITTARSKTDTIQTEDKKVKKVGMKEIQREGFEYELTLNFNLDRDGHYAMASKDRTGMFIDADPFKITRETGEKILEWTMKGNDPAKSPTSPSAPPATPKAQPTTAARTSAKPAPKPHPTKQTVMEKLTACKDATTLQQVYDRAFVYRWPMDEAKDITDCYLAVFCRICTYLRKGEELCDTSGQVIAKIVRRENGFATVQKVPVPTEDELAQAERAGMKIDSTVQQ